MSDQNVIADWRSYFEELNKKGGVANTQPDFYSLFKGEARPWVMFVSDPATGELEGFPIPCDGEEFESFRCIYEDNEGPEMWLFWNLVSAPWRCPGLPKPKNGATKTVRKP